MTFATRKRKPAKEGGAVFDRELEDLPQELRWRGGRRLDVPDEVPVR